MGTGVRTAFCRTLAATVDQDLAVKAAGRSMRNPRLVPLAMAAVLGSLFLVLYAYAWQVPSTSSAPRPLDRIRAIAAGEAVARASVGDPESAQFRYSVVYEKWKVPVTCGEINYRRATGGYAGFQRFVSAGPVAQLEESMSAEQFRRLWSVMCERDE